MSTPELSEFFRSAPDWMDVPRIEHEWRAVERAWNVDSRVLPLPLWAQRPFTSEGAQAWEDLKQDLQAPSSRAFCIYLHIPFCASKCGFCDSYSFKLGAHQPGRIADYVARLARELELWSRQGNLAWRPVSTVHFGGGTPAFLGIAPFRRLIERVAEYFNISSHTEWALESTVSELSDEMLHTLHDLGFRRLHIGVQSLEDEVRAAIGRRSPAVRVLDKIAQALALGWVVSVDLICGLPGQTLAGLLQGIDDLARIGVDGFSLYELLIYPQNRKWAERHALLNRSHLANYWLFQAGARYLHALGYRKNLFNHWANARDANVYFTFPTRGEDLLAVGAIADGVFGDYHYRHPRYWQYLEASNAHMPGLQGGLRRTAQETYLHPLTTALLAGYIAPELVPSFQIPLRSSDETLITRWQALALVEEAQEDGAWQLTTNGSWFAGNMVAQLHALALPWP